MSNSGKNRYPGEVDDGATVGYSYSEETSDPVLGNESRIRHGTIIYDDVIVGEGFNTGHFALVREFTEAGDNVLVGTRTVIDGRTDIGSDVSLQTGVYVPSQTKIGDNVFIGPSAILTNDPYPVRQEVDLAGPTIERGVSIGANSTILPDVTIGEGSFVAAGSIVTKDVPPESLAVGAPATHEPLPESLAGPNQI